MLRRLFALVSALSLLLCVAATAMWVRGYWAGDAWFYTWAKPAANSNPEQVDLDGWYFGSASGGCALVFDHTRYERTDYEAIAHDLPRPGFRYDRFEAPAPTRPRRGLGFFFERIVMKGPAPETVIRACAPGWAIVVATMMLPAFGLWRYLRCGDRTGLCTTCGYDLRATPDRCPECGTITDRARAVGGDLLV
jgi:hypothetical protein